MLPAVLTSSLQLSASLSAVLVSSDLKTCAVGSLMRIPLEARETAFLTYQAKSSGRINAAEKRDARVGKALFKVGGDICTRTVWYKLPTSSFVLKTSERRVED